MNNPAASFCMSTYKRPALLQTQLEQLAKQTYKNFEVIISDNDPERTGEAVVAAMGDARFKYFSNVTNLGMVKSFNKSIERANGEYVVMVTDDDPVNPEMLTELLDLAKKYPSYPVYCGCVRSNKQEGLIEIFGSEDFIYQLLHPSLSSEILWSGCLLKRDITLQAGGMPDYGSPHLADHAMLVLCSRFGGGVFINKVYSTLTKHDKNFSKSNFELYYIGCEKFYELITTNFSSSAYKKGNDDALFEHLKNWFMANSFALRKYFTYKNRNRDSVKDVIKHSRQMLKLPFMKPVYPEYIFKLMLFTLKGPLYFLKYSLGKK